MAGLIKKIEKKIKEKISQEFGSSTVELVLLTAAFVSIALIFNTQITEFVDSKIDVVLETSYDADHFLGD